MKAKLCPVSVVDLGWENSFLHLPQWQQTSTLYWQRIWGTRGSKWGREFSLSPWNHGSVSGHLLCSELFSWVLRRGHGKKPISECELCLQLELSASPNWHAISCYSFMNLLRFYPISFFLPCMAATFPCCAFPELKKFVGDVFLLEGLSLSGI